ncbi:MAG TPA: YggS family pyridoxal phosphate-dependent enzyme [Lachnospiraceae bacterium]|nr:YggS family pyridoxal phosphate-dependent enzyme [Lachnospiraceae bacterium]
MLKENLEKVKEQIAKACERSGRSAQDVTIVAVSKTKPEEAILELYHAGHRDFGENYIQELRVKHDDLPKDIRWHMIGHLQRNKVKYIAEYIHLIHSVDSFQLAETIEKEAAKHDRIIPILIEVNVGGEESKFGVTPEEAPVLIEKISHLPHVRVEGLMTSAPYVEDPEEDRPCFAKMRDLSVDIASKKIDNVKVNVLSMGMSNDYIVAAEEGSTMVRVGTSIFGERDYSNK